ncbi:MAG: serine protease, partial [Alphaproteobacteria bacterium]|nr:serine protease [Alphaproteobacteria bacterium]
TGVLERPGKGLRAQRVYIHPSADVALMTVGRAGPPVRVADREPQPGDVAYHVGCPRGQPGEMRSRLIGAGMMNVTGRYSTRERVLAWAEVERVPNDSSPLSGLSGGPVFDAAGRLVGVHVAGSKRRGRSYTAAPRSIAEALAADGVQVSAQGVAPDFSPASFVDQSNALRAAWTVAKALCDVR